MACLSCCKECCSKCKWVKQRYVIAFMCFLCLVNSYTMRNCLSMSITEMVYHKKSGLKESDECPGEAELAKKAKISGPRFNWNEKDQGNILGAFYYGYVLSHIPGGMMSEFFGAKHVLGFGVLITTIMTLVTPVFAHDNMWPIFSVRFISGLGSGVLFPSLTALLARWSPPEERGILGALTFAGTQIGNVVGNSLSGILMSTFGWPSVFYFFGAGGIIWFITWNIFVYSEPDSHPFISDEEKQFLQEKVGNLTDRKNLKMTPWLYILLSKPVWACLFLQWGHSFGLFLMQSMLPKYLRSVLKLSSVMNGVLSSLPYLSMWIFAILSGYLCDVLSRKKIVSNWTNRWVLNTVSQVGPAIGCILAAYSGCNYILATVWFTIGMALMGPYFPAAKINILDLSPNYGGSVSAIVNGLGSTAGIAAPTIAGHIITNNKMSEWQAVYWMNFAVLIGTNIVYNCGGTADLQPWNDPDKMKADKDAAQ